MQRVAYDGWLPGVGDAAQGEVRRVPTEVEGAEGYSREHGHLAALRGVQADIVDDKGKPRELRAVRRVDAHGRDEVEEGSEVVAAGGRGDGCGPAENCAR